jgi:hypothetical protein
MSPNEIRACHRLYTAYRTSHGIGPVRRMLASFATQLRHHGFVETFAQVMNLR